MFSIPILRSGCVLVVLILVNVLAASQAFAFGRHWRHRSCGCACSSYSAAYTVTQGGKGEKRLGLTDEEVVIYVQNNSDDDAEIYIDGSYQGEAPAHNYVTVPTTIGSHRLSYRRAGITSSYYITVSRAYQTINI